MSKDREMMIEQDYAPERVERDAGFFARLGWILALVGAGSFFV
ncbi:membrane fusion protein [Pseudomonas sp. St29]|nr:membrane fusion protein [Pseudomonas sp. St29]